MTLVQMNFTYILVAVQVLERVLVKAITGHLTRILKHHGQRLDQPSILVKASTGNQQQILMALLCILHFILPAKQGF